MWSKLDDALYDHPKIVEAGELIGKNGMVIALGFYTACVLYCNKHLTDGYLTKAVLAQMPHHQAPLELADHLVVVGLLDSAPRGYRIHDYLDHNPTAESVRKKRAEDRARKRNAA